MYIDFHAPVESLNRHLSVVLRTKRCQLDLEKNKRCPFTLRPEDVEDWLALNPPCSHLNMDPSLAGVQPTIPSECEKLSWASFRVSSARTKSITCQCFAGVIESSSADY